MSNKSIIIPVNNKPTKIESVQNFVIVGANGSGKSHLGAWIEQQSANGEVLRISAQRALSIPDSSQSKAKKRHGIKYIMVKNFTMIKITNGIGGMD